MKKLLLSLSVVVLLAGLSGCGKDDPAPSEVCTARIDGLLFEGNDMDGEIETDGDVVIYGYKGDYGFIFSFNKDDVEEGETYDVGKIGAGFTAEDGEIFIGTGGEVHITKFTNTRFEATFEFSADGFDGGDMEVTDGVIKVDLE